MTRDSSQSLFSKIVKHLIDKHCEFSHKEIGWFWFSDACFRIGAQISGVTD